MKVCVLGNSQVACLKAAWDAPINRPTGAELTFFAAFWMTLKHLEVEGDRLVPAIRTLRRQLLYTAGEEEIEVPRFDCFLLCGLGIDPQPLDTRLSSQARRATIDDWVKSSLAYCLAAKLRHITSAPVFVMHSPLPDERTRGRITFPFTAYQEDFEMMSAALDIAASRMLPQPAETITQQRFTKLAFSKDAVRLAVHSVGEGVRHETDDVYHMNALYGATQLRNFFGASRTWRAEPA
jgi:hypothetical protein